MHVCIWFGVTLRKDTVSVKKAKFVSREFHHTVMHGFRNNYLVLYGRGFEGYLNYMLELCVNVFFVKIGMPKFTCFSSNYANVGLFSKCELISLFSLISMS